MKIVAFFGAKGGTGKSTLAHLLAYGASLQGQAALVIHTDARKPERGLALAVPGGQDTGIQEPR